MPMSNANLIQKHPQVILGSHVYSGLSVLQSYCHKTNPQGVQKTRAHRSAHYLGHLTHSLFIVLSTPKISQPPPNLRVRPCAQHNCSKHPFLWKLEPLEALLATELSMHLGL